MNILENAKKYEDYIIGLRREFHRIPEESLKEFKTCQKIQDKLKEMGLEPVVMAGTGVVAEIGGARPGRTVALRADIDGLVVTEETSAPFASEHEGFMHACGHDAHIAMLLGAARVLLDRREELQGSVRLIFQPGEEGFLGSILMIEEGVLDGAASIFGVHIWSELAAGKVSVESGPRMASADGFRILVHGKGSHGAMPEKGVDAIVAGAAIVSALQTLVSRELPPQEPVVVTVGEFKAGAQWNVLAEEALLGGTVRTFNEEIHDKIPGLIERVARNTAAAFRAEITFDYNKVNRVTINDPACSTIAARAAVEALGREALTEMPKTVTSEDFSEYQRIVPGVFAFLGTQNEAAGAVWPQHSPRYTIDESVLVKGAALEAQYALTFLSEAPGKQCENHSAENNRGW
jgi:amidohydrolase